MLRGMVFTVRFTPEQDEAARQIGDVCRAVWNTGLDQRRQYRQRRAFISMFDQQKQMSAARNDPVFAWMKDAPSHVLQQTLKDLDAACRKVGPGKVRWRSKHRWPESFRFPEGKHMRVQRLSRRWGQINLPLLGQVRFRMTRELDEQIRSATVSWRDGRWQISLLVEDGVLAVTPPVPDPRPAVGIDRGVKVALALSDGRMMDRQFITEHEVTATVRIQRQMARQQGPRTKPSKAQQRAKPKARGRRQQPSARYLRSRARLAKIHARARRRRDDFLAKTAHTLAGEHRLIVLEKLNTSRMTKAPKARPDADRPGAFLPNQSAAKAGLNRAILGKGWGKFASALQHQARYTGTEIALVPAAFTSQRCHTCGHTAPENRKSQAKFECIQCGLQDNADTNAARNILAAGLAVTGRASPGTTGSVNHQNAA